MVYLFIYVLVLLQSNQQISADLAAVKSSLVRMQNLAESNWKLSKPQQAMLKSIVRHTLIIPRGTYGDIAEAAAAHVKAQAGTINLTQYITDPTVRIVVDGFLVRQVNEFRSNLRKSLFSAVKDKKPLRKLARELVDAYHLPTVPDIIPNNILATLALMREVAAPLVGQSNVRDTKFWKNLEVALDDLYGKEQNGEDRQSLAWKQWETNIIHKDEETYRARSAASVPATRQEIMQNTEQLTDVEDRDVHMSELGDFAAVLAGASQ
ncbi:hypothetical protein PLICRDRAFT_296457 [Plicaturopsis crispa FD-325 SS-3]|nr:hypothetical protein PLICRDRAFT_296457 [Plicaturopsis crispa FD-325 SS-3]